MYKKSPQNKISTLLELYKKGSYDLAEILAKRITHQSPNQLLVWKVLSAIHQHAGKLQESLAAIQKALKIKPNDVESHYILSKTLQLLGKLEDAEANYKKTITLKPDHAEAYYNLGNTLQLLGKLEDAEANYKKTITLMPDHAEAYYNLGNTLQLLGKLEDAEIVYKKAIALRPDYAEAYSNLGVALQLLGKIQDAKISYIKAIALKPDYAEVYSNLGGIMQLLDKLDDAEIAYKKAIALKPDYAEAHNNLGGILLSLGKLEDAEIVYKKAIALKPDYAEAYSNLGIALQLLGKLEDAKINYIKAIALKRDYAEAYNNLGNTLLKLNELEDAEIVYKKTIALKPDNAEAYNNLGGILLSLGKIEDAEIVYKKAIALKPDYAEVSSNLLFCYSNMNSIDPEELYARHCFFGQQLEGPLRNSWKRHDNLKVPERCLQIGFISGDFHGHPIANYIAPILEHLALYPKLSLHAYCNSAISDDTTDRLKTYFAYWHQTNNLSDDVLAEKILLDGIDILFDLSGHTGKNRLQTFARKPAPIQISWLGYPGTTGLMAMDYYITDRFLVPTRQAELFFTEKIVRLPASAPFRLLDNIPPINPLPSLKNGYTTFGSFNRRNKINLHTISLWSKILRAIPNSRIFLGAMEIDRDDDTLIGYFGQEGITRERISFFKRCNLDTYLKLHYQIDICLDTFPYGASTTSCYALLMGVPTLTLVGRNMASRVGAWAQSHSGLEGFISHHETELIEKALYWVDHLIELASIREGLRARFMASAMWQESLIAEALDCALRIMWQRWCAGLPSESFEITKEDLSNG